MQNTPDILQPDEAHLILSLRLLIARAANKDSLAWWDDEALTPSASFLLGRLFPVAPPLAARSLALRAALARHRAAYASYQGALHLYRLDLDNLDKLALRYEPLLPIPVSSDPITTMDVLRRQLVELVGQPLVYKVVRRRDTHTLQLEIPPPPGDISPLVHRAKSLAWAYLEGRPGQAVFPYISAA